MAVGGYIRRMWRQPSGRRRVLAVALAGLSVLAFAGPASADSSQGNCGAAVLDDWTKGTLGSGYSPDCYEAALDALPEDLRAYTTAADDITRSAIAASRMADGTAVPASRQLADTPPAEHDLRAFPTEVVLLAGVLAVLLAAGVAAALMRRRRPR